MRKIYLSLFLSVVCVAANAQIAAFRFHGQLLEDNSLVVVEAEEDDFGELSCMTNPYSNPTNGLQFVNLTGGDLTGNSTLTITSNSFNSPRFQWCMGGMCMTFSELTQTKAYTVLANSSINVDFDAYPSEYGELQAKLSALANFQTFSVQVKFVYSDPAHISGTETDVNSPVSVYNLSGDLVMKAADRSMLSLLQRGVYVYKTTTVDGKTEVRKVAIR